MLHTVSVLLACAVLGFLGLATAAMADTSENEPGMSSLFEVRGIIVREDGAEVLVTALVDASLIDPESALEELYPGQVQEPTAGMAEAMWSRWFTWASEDIPVVVAYNPANEPAGVDGELAVHSGMETWNGAGQNAFWFNYGGWTSTPPDSCKSGLVTPDQVNIIGWRTDLPTGILATTCVEPSPAGGRQAIEMDMVISTRISWSTAAETPEEAYDLRSNVLHELGHVLGLDHSNADGAVMASRLEKGTQVRELTKDDIDGVRAIYPGTPPTPEPRPPLPHTLALAGIVRDTPSGP